MQRIDVGPPDRESAKTRIMRVALVSMPWAYHYLPSPALGALQAFLRREQPEVQVDCCNEHLAVATRIGTQRYTALSEWYYAEIIYCGILYPDYTHAVVDILVERFTRIYQSHAEMDHITSAAIAVLRHRSAREIVTRLTAHIEESAEKLARYDLVGMTAVHNQLFANLCLAKKIKEQFPRSKIVLGGPILSGQVGPSVLKEYPHIDYIVQGEGELPLNQLIRNLRENSFTEPIAGVITAKTASRHPNGVESWEIPCLDDLPYPDFDEYDQLAKDNNVDWTLPIEGSRGCWWDRSKKTCNPRNACTFCNFNIQWNGYREKSVDRLLQELRYLTDHYDKDHFRLLDNIHRKKGIRELAAGLASIERKLAFYSEFRASVKPFELLLLKNAGLETAQFGIEGLDASFLRRIGKGTTMLQNLQALKVTEELEIENTSNLIVFFPSSTLDEVENTVAIIDKYAHQFYPLSISFFSLYRGSPVDKLRDEFPIEKVRNADYFKSVLPEDVYDRLQLGNLSFDHAETPADWNPVLRAVDEAAARYREFKRQNEKMGEYRVDGERIAVYRAAWSEPMVLRGEQKELFLYLGEIRNKEAIEERFPNISTEYLAMLLGKWEEKGIVARDCSQVLAMIPAATVELAANRILEHELERLPCLPAHLRILAERAT